MFREKGYTDASLDDIAAEIGITKPAIYNYFKAKEDLLYEICLAHVDNMTKGIQRIANSDLVIEEKVVQLFADNVLQFHNNRDIAEAFLRESPHLSLERRKKLSAMMREIDYIIREHVDIGIKAGVFRPINSRHVVRGLNGMTTWLGFWYDPSGPDSIQVILDAYTDFIKHGLLCAK